MSSDLRPNAAMVFPGGWHVIPPLVQADRLDSLDGSLDGLYSAVEHYRLDNDIPVGDVRADVDAQLCSRHPHWCGGVISSSVTLRQAEQPTPTDLLIDDVTQWALALLRREEPFQLVALERADRRAERCKMCPHNVSIQHGCGNCVQNAERQCASVRGVKDTSLTRDLGCCDRYRLDNRTAVFVEREFLPAPRTDVPEFCWMR